MTTIIERPEGGGSGMVVVAAIVGALATAVIGLFAFGAFDRNPTSTSVTIEQPAVPATPTTDVAPPAQSTPAPTQEAAPSTEPAPPATPDTTETEPTAPPAPAQQ